MNHPCSHFSGARARPHADQHSPQGVCDARKPSRARSALALSATILVATLAATLSACALPPSAPPPAPPAPVGLAEVLERPAERALADGMRAYDDAQYPQAEAALRKALAAGLQSPRDRANAHKLLAFITCTSDRMPDCEAAFAAARKAWPGFQLSKSEAGHPLWGPVARRVLP